MAAFAAALILAVSLFATDRQPGQSVTGSFAQTAQQQIEESLAQAATDENQGQVGQAAQLYQSVLTNHPDNEVAMAQLGWLEYQIGARGAEPLADRRRAGQAQPGGAARPRATMPPGCTWGRSSCSRTATPPARWPSTSNSWPTVRPESIVEQAAPEVRQAFQKAGVPVPPAVGA